MKCDGFAYGRRMHVCSNDAVYQIALNGTTLDVRYQYPIEGRYACADCARRFDERGEIKSAMRIPTGLASLFRRPEPETRIRRKKP